MKQVKPLKSVKPKEHKENIKSVEEILSKEMITNEIKNEIDKTKTQEEKVKRENLIYKANKYKYDFQQHETVRYFGESIYTGKVNTDKAEIDLSNLFKNLAELSKKPKLKTKEGKGKKEKPLKVQILFMKVENQFLMLSEVEYFQ